MVQKIRLSCILQFPDDMHGENVLALAHQIGESIDAAKDVTISQVANRPTLGAVLSEFERILVDAEFRDMGFVQTMPGSNEDIQRFFRDNKELVDISSTNEPDKDTLEALLDGEEECGQSTAAPRLIQNSP